MDSGKLEYKILNIKKPIDKDYNIVSKGYVDNDIMKMDSRELLKNKIFKIEESMGSVCNLVDFGYVEEVNDEVNLKLNDAMKMVLEISYLLANGKSYVN